jgi:hypothetical protein
MQYPAATLSFQKGKYYAVVTIPEPLREYFKGRKQLKRSTGTSDRKLAEQNLHRKTSEIYGELEKANQKLSPIYVALRNYIEAIGTVIPPFLMGPSRRIQAAVFSFMAGVMPPIPILGRSLL